MRLALLLACVDADGVASTVHSAVADSPGGDSPAADSVLRDSAGPDSGDTGHPPVPLNVLLLSIDTLRADQVQLGTGAMPWLAERFAASGRVVSGAYSGGAWTYAGGLGVHTGLLPVAIGPASYARVGDGYPLAADELVLLAEHFAGAGYATGFITGNALWGGNTNLDQGVEAADYLTGLEPGDYGVELQGEASLIEARAWTTAHAGPWFLNVHLVEPHDPYEHPDPSCAAAAAALAIDCPYDLALGGETLKMSADAREGTLAGETLAACTLATRTGHDCDALALDAVLARYLPEFDDGHTVIAVVGDHGEQHGDPYFNHNNGLYPADTTVPLWVDFPGAEAPAMVVTTATGTQALPPTLLARAGLSYDAASFSLAPIGEASTGPPLALWCVNGQLQSGGAWGDSADGSLRYYAQSGDGHRTLYDPATGFDTNIFGTEPVDAVLQAAVVAQAEAVAAAGFCLDN